MPAKRIPHPVRYDLDPRGSFVIENYQQAKPFCNFFPGVAGVWGIPMWVFYVNRGQAISSFGIESKDKAIAEFQPANKAYRLASHQGFRTFLKIKDADRIHWWEPFQGHGCRQAFVSHQKMMITAHDLTLEDVNETLGVTVRVNYFTISQEDFPALVRRVWIENHSSRAYGIELIDGLPTIMAYGLSDWIIKNMSRTVEAWVKVHQLEKRTPYYHLNVEVSDTPDVKHIREGHFYFAFDPALPKSKRLAPIVEASLVFGQCTDFSCPQRFFSDQPFRIPRQQQTDNRTPSALCYHSFTMAAGQQRQIYSMVGYAHSQAHLQQISRKFCRQEVLDRKAQLNQDVIHSIRSMAATRSASRAFDLYADQNFLDNVLRGGLPVSLQTEEGPVAFNVFSRKHGDPERDYNFFKLSPTHFSQGNGNYRDVNQNRRNDAWFNQDVKDNTIINFFNLSQADGYNPLIVKGMSFYIEDTVKLDKVLKDCLKDGSDAVRQRLGKDFQPGELLDLVHRQGIGLKVPKQVFLGRVLGLCRKHELAEHGEGFWSDHWTYNLDLVDSYLRLYPEDLHALLLEKKVFSFFHNSHYILPRDERYVLTDKGVRQYYFLHDGGWHQSGAADGTRLRTKGGKGDVYFTTLLVKLLCVVTNKAATFDPSGIGIEMEGGRPNWYDALNGLPGLCGSSLCETLELKRFCRFLLDSLDQLELDSHFVISVFVELALFMKGLKSVLIEEKDPASYWHRSNDIKEQYRLSIREGISGEEEIMPLAEVRELLALVIERTERAEEHAVDNKGLLRSYFRHEVIDYALLNKHNNGYAFVLPVKFRRHALPLFLEGFVHALRTRQGTEQQARQFHQQVLKSPLYDRKLRMLKNNDDLSQESEEIGRSRIFPPGWLENESVWLHMEYKYLLELLRCGLNQEFYALLKDTLVPFLKPEVYGRSTLENSSFLVSSAHADAQLHGQGFVARLSGSTAEFLHIWLLMNAGLRPFRWDPRQGLSFVLEPILSAGLFSSQQHKIEIVDTNFKHQVVDLPKNSYAFILLGSTLVVYHNPKRLNTFGPGKVSVSKMVLTWAGQQRSQAFPTGTVPSAYAKDIRDHRVVRIDAELS